MALTRLGEIHEIKPVSMPKLIFCAGQDDPKEAAERVMTIRVVRAGRDAWEKIGRADSFEGWAAIGKALAVGRDHALKSTGANAPMGRRYSVAFSAWCREYGFAGIQKSVRSTALELNANIEAITLWRDGLPERQRKRLVHPLSVTRRWRAATATNSEKCPTDLKRVATAAWRRFRACLGAMPRDEAIRLWLSMLDEAADIIPARTRTRDGIECFDGHPTDTAYSAD